MTRRLQTISVLALSVLALGACGPSVNVTRMQAMPARGADCELEFVQIDLSQITLEKQWTIVGYVNVSDTGEQDPLSEDNRKIVRSKACELGGEAVAIGLSSSSQSAMGGGSGTMYAVLVPYTEPSSEKSSF